MKTVILTSAVMLAVASGVAEAKGGGRSSGSSHSVSGHVTKSGTYVAPHHATNPNATKADNWTTRGNVNPFTGQPGTRNP